jgi:aspartate/methionine/tyrosine aminotransferase
MRLTSRTLDQIDSPIETTYALLAGHRTDGTLLDLAQAAPAYPPAPEVVEHIARVAREPDGGYYVESAGLTKLREAVADDLNAGYRAVVPVENILITAGCNQAFCLVTSALATPGDEIVLPQPYYFNHDMWLRLNGVVPVYLAPGPVPDIDAAAAAITPRTRAIVLVSPGNPSGVTIDPGTIAAFAAVAARHGIALVLDETYRSFRATDEPAHRIFADPGWAETVVSLHSFSKEFAIPGYRVGAVIASGALIREAMKLLDCVAVCAPRIGQEAAWAGLTMATGWRRERIREAREKQRVFADAMSDRPGGFELVSCGAYFGWIRHPFIGRPTAEVVRALLAADVLVLPGTAFGRTDMGMVRVSLANLDLPGIREFTRRLQRHVD